jgi:hypothetical protein
MAHYDGGDRAIAESLIAKGYLRFRDDEYGSLTNTLLLLNQDWNRSKNELCKVERHVLTTWASALDPTYRALFPAHWILENPEFVRDKVVVELGAGAGVVAVASVKAGARKATTIDIVGQEIVWQNAMANNVSNKIDIVQSTIFSDESLKIIAQADVVSLSAFFMPRTRRGADINIQHILFQQIKRGATLIVGASSRACDMGWDLLERFGTPIETQEKPDMLFKPDHPSFRDFNFKMFTVTPGQVVGCQLL